MGPANDHGASRASLNSTFPEIGHGNRDFMTQVQLIREMDTTFPDVVPQIHLEFSDSAFRSGERSDAGQ